MPEHSASTTAALDIDDAAARLGIDPETVQRALQRGLLAGFQTPEGEWKVFLETQEPASSRPYAGEPAPAVEAPPAARQVPATKDAASDAEGLRALLRQREEEIREKDRLIAELARSLARLGEAAVERLRADEPPLRTRNLEPPAQAPQHGLEYDDTIDTVRRTLRLVRNYLVQQKRQFPDDQ